MQMKASVLPFRIGGGNSLFGMKRMRSLRSEPPKLHGLLAGIQSRKCADIFWWDVKTE